MTRYPAISSVPFLVRRAMRLAEEASFENSSTPYVGRLLGVLAAQVQSGLIVEIGAGYGVGSSWIVSSLAPGTRFVTVELDPERATAVGRLLASHPNVEVIEGDWHGVLERSPFAMLFADGGRSKILEPNALIQSLQPGGIVLLDDLTPQHLLPPDQQEQPDPVRDRWLNDDCLVSAEIMVSPAESVILATRKP